MADRTNLAAPTPQDEMLEALVSVTAENTTTLLNVEHQAAVTAASVKDARTYMATVVKNTDWETNGKKIAAILDKAMREDRAALNAAAKAADDMQTMSVGISHKVDAAADAQQKASLAFHTASERLLSIMEAHEQGKWRRMGMMALVAALTAALGLFGGYWWANGNIQKARLAEVGELLRSSGGEDFCGDMSGTVLEADNNGVYCASWIKQPTE
ncbi:MAG: hypothetical protein KJ834_18125 [Alphaproteobacteria bacterium]|nr:hypothetical protein [Alphaproteobacteria bacterium]